jgi:diguanylate cyclase (GGDEF)-like protein
LYETSLEINAQVNLPSLLQSVVERAARLVDAPLGGLYMLRPDHETLRMDYIYNLPKDFIGTTLSMGEGAAGRVAVSGLPFTVENYQQWEGRVAAFADLAIQRTLCVPVKTSGEVIGVINVADNRRTDTFSPENIRLVSLFADQAAIAIQNARLYEQVQRLATLDVLTGLYNRRGFFMLAERIFQLAHRSTNELVMIFIDIDHMKQINDQLGHSTGDQALVDAASVLRSTFRVTDVIARVGGDEFAVLAYPSAEEHINQLLKRLQLEIARFNTWAQRPFVLSLSAGCTAWTPGCTDTLDNLISRADEAMYTVKRQKL